jgi:hypothetical protein
MNVSYRRCLELGLMWRRGATIVSCALVLLVLLTTPVPAKAQISDFFKNLIGGGEQEEVSPVEETSVSTCPENMLRLTGLPEEGCGTDRPPASHAVVGGINGLWDVEAPGNPFFETALVTLNRGYASLGYRAAGGAWVAAGIARKNNKAWFSDINPSAKALEDGSLRLHLTTGGFCGCVKYLVTVKPTGDPNVMVGEWTYGDDKKGFAVIRRRPPGNFRSVEYVNISADPSQRYVRDRVAFGTRPLKIERRHPVSCNGARANCGGIWITIYGDNLAGGHDVWIDPASKVENQKAGWLCSNGDFRGSGAEWTKCGSTNVPGDGVIGLRLRLLFWDGMTPGAKTLWIDGHPIHLEIKIDGFPEEDKEKKPALVLLDALNMQGEQITQVDEGEPFVLKAIYDGPHPDSWVTLDVPSVRPAQAPDNAEKREVVLRRTDDPKIFRSDWLAVEAGPAVE